MSKGSATMMAIASDLVLMGGIFIVLNALPLPPLLACTDPLTQKIALAGSVMLMLQLSVGVKIVAQFDRRLRALEIVLLLLVVWLGSYPFSPLGFSDGRIPVLRGFSVITPTRREFHILPGEILLLGNGAIAAFKPLMLTGDVRCNWSSANGGALDDPQSCDVVYNPPDAEYDILKVSIRPGCGLPHSIEQIRVSILP